MKYKTFLSGMIEIAYFIGHADWQVTVCVPREAECLVLLDDAAKLDAEIRRAVERRNECYRMAFSYLKDMAARRQVRVFTRVEEAVRHIRDATQCGTGSVDLPDGAESTDVPEEMQPQQKRTALRQILEKQHLVKERTSQNLLAHLREAAARGQHLRLDPAEIRPDGELDMDPESLIIPVPESPIRS